MNRIILYVRDVTRLKKFYETDFGLSRKSLGNGRCIRQDRWNWRCISWDARIELGAGPSFVLIFPPSLQKGLAYIRHSDHLGSARLATTPARAMYASAAYAPYGEAYAQAGAADLSFTGQDQDTTSGMYDFMVRKYNPVQGRWLSPDPAGLGAVDPANPQTWNRYAYVGNNPLSLIDPLGADAYEGCDRNVQWWCFEGSWTAWIQGLNSMSGWGDPFQVASVPVVPEDFHGTVEVKNGHVFISSLTSSPNPNFVPTDPKSVEFFFKQSWRDAGPVQFSGPIIWQLATNGSLASSNGQLATNVGSLVKDGLNYLKTHPVTASVTEVLSLQATYQASTKTLCINFGAGASLPPSKMVTVGVLNEGDMGKWTDVQSSWGYSFGANLILGYQGSFNSSGKVGGPSVSGIGVSGSYTYGWCE